MNSSNYEATYHITRDKYHHHTWNQATTVPLLLTDRTNDYLYRPGGVPIEQSSSTGTTVRLLTNTTGTAVSEAAAAGEISGGALIGATAATGRLALIGVRVIAGSFWLVYHYW